MHSTKIHFLAKLRVGKNVAELFRVKSDTFDVTVVQDVHLSYYGCNRRKHTRDGLLLSECSLMEIIVTFHNSQAGDIMCT